MLFVGVDLAWSPKNGTGVAILEGDNRRSRLSSRRVLFSDKEIMDYIKDGVGGRHAVIAIDAPLIVPNRTGRRVAEEVVGNLFRKYDAGAHPANRQRLSQWSGKIRGEEIAKLLTKEGFEHNPYLKRSKNTRAFFEVYPHPSMVVLFGLDRILRYKAKPKRDYEFRWNEFERYHSHLKKLRSADPAMDLPSDLLSIDLRSLKGNALKSHEDTLDAVFSAYIAQYAWVHPDHCAVLGDMKKGYILTPILPEMRKILPKN